MLASASAAVALNGASDHQAVTVNHQAERFQIVKKGGIAFGHAFGPHDLPAKCCAKECRSHGQPMVTVRPMRPAWMGAGWMVMVSVASSRSTRMPTLAHSD